MSKNPADINEIDEQIRQLYRKRMEIYSEPISPVCSDDLKKEIEHAINCTHSDFPEFATVACQGTEGAYSQEAAQRLFKYPGIMYFRNFENVFSAIESGLCEYGILPIENSTAGSVNKIYDLMRDHRFYIVRSIRLKIEHNLLAQPGTRTSDIKEIYSHEQAFAQCEEYLRKHYEGAKITVCSNTADAAKRVAESESRDKAAICSAACEHVYNLKTLAGGIQDHNYNYTRFICISKELQIYPGADKTSFMAEVSHKPGSLYNVLKTFADSGYNLLKLESRPIPDTEFEFMFYFDFEASVYHKKFTKTMARLQEICDDMEYLGTYNEKL